VVGLSRAEKGWVRKWLPLGWISNTRGGVNAGEGGGKAGKFGEGNMGERI